MFVEPGVNVSNGVNKRRAVIELRAYMIMDALKIKMRTLINQINCYFSRTVCQRQTKLAVFLSGRNIIVCIHFNARVNADQHLD